MNASVLPASPIDSRRAVRVFYLLAFGLTWGVGSLGLLVALVWPGHPFDSTSPLYFVAAFGPTLAGVVASQRSEGWAGVGRRLRKMVPTSRHLHWYAAVAAIGPAVMVIVATVVSGYSLSQRAALGGLWGALVISPIRDAGPIGEEFGWRGFALPTTLRFRSPLAAAVILGLIWTAWHIPTFFITTLTQSRLSFPTFVMSTTALSITMTWLYIRTDGDLALMVLAHLVSNDCVGILGVSLGAETAGEVLIAAAIVAAGGLSRRTPEKADSRGG